MANGVPAINRIEETVGGTLSSAGCCVLAVSGGRDSMVLLDAAARLPSAAERLIVATFDHGTGEAARAAVELAAGEAADRGLACVIGHAAVLHRAEAAWRAERWQFLRDVARRERARIVTAHTRDDQLETVVMRVLRGSGARGLAGLEASSDVLRPLLSISRADVAEYARLHEVRYVEDPTNLSRRYLRNRIRLDLLPAIERVRPSFGEEMLALAGRAAVWRGSLTHVLDALGPMFLDRGTIRIAAESLQGYDAASLRILWPEVAARVGVTMDRRGTERAAAFTIEGIAGRMARGGRRRVIQLSGGAEIEQIGDAFVLRAP